MLMFFDRQRYIGLQASFFIALIVIKQFNATKFMKVKLFEERSDKSSQWLHWRIPWFFQICNQSIHILLKALSRVYVVELVADNIHKISKYLFVEDPMKLGVLRFELVHVTYFSEMSGWASLAKFVKSLFISRFVDDL